MGPDRGLVASPGRAVPGWLAALLAALVLLAGISGAAALDGSTTLEPPQAPSRPFAADGLDSAALNALPPDAHISSVMAGDALVRDRGGRPIGLAYNHRLQSAYRGTYPRTVPGTRIVSGSLIPPPFSQAVPSGPVDILAHWYGDWGLDWYRQATGIARPSFDGWYDWRWNWTSTPAHRPDRQSVLGYYRNDDARVLDWQCYWLREAGVRGYINVTFALDITTWHLPGDRNHWAYQQFNNAPNCRALAYVPWAQTVNFDGGAAGLTPVQLTAQWRSLYYSLARVHPNNYALRHRGKRWFTVYAWDTETARTAIFDPRGGSLNLTAFLKARAVEVRAEGYDGLAVLVHNATPETVMSRADLLAGDVLYLPSPYAGPVDSDPASVDYARVVASYTPPPSGKVLSISTALKIVDPLPASRTFDYDGSTPALFRELASDALRWIASHRRLPQVLTVSNVSEWAEQGPGLHPNVRDGWGYLDALRGAGSLADRPDSGRAERR